MSAGKKQPWRALLIALLLPACVESSTTVCASGRVCPDEFACDDIHSLCVLPEQLVACQPTDVTCTLPSGTIGSCDQGVCIEDVCGDRVVTGEEDCEPGDGTTWACQADGGYYDELVLECSNRCVFPESMCTGTCGDGIVNGPAGQEVCDGSLPTGSCLDYGFEAGRIACNDSACSPAFAACRDIGFLPLYTTNGTFQRHAYVADSDHLFILEAVADVVEVQGGAVVKRMATGGINSGVALWGASPTDIHVIDNSGTIRHYDGTTWIQTKPSAGNLTAIWGSGPSNVYAVGVGERIFHNTGSGWQLISSIAGTNQWFAIHGTSATSIFVVGDTGRVRRFDGTWSDMNAAACWGAGPTPAFRGVWSSGPSSVFAVGTLPLGAGSIICHYNGAAWTRQLLDTSGLLLTAVWGRSASDVYAVGTNGAVLHHNGHVWRRLALDELGVLTFVGGTSDAVFVLGESGIARRYAGAAYATEALAGSTFTQLATSGPQHEYVMSSDFVYWRRPDGWLELFAGTGNLFAMWADASGAVVAAESNGNVFHFDGVNTTTTSTLTFTAFGMAGRSPTDVFAVGDDGDIARYTGTWAPMTSNTGADLADIAVTATSAFAVGRTTTTTGFITRHTAADGWVAMPVPVVPSLMSVYAASDTDVFAVGAGGTILHYDGASWTAMNAGGLTADLHAVAGTSGTDVFATGSGGHLLHYDGIAWSPVRGQVQSTFAIAVRPDAVLLAGMPDES